MRSITTYLAYLVLGCAAFAQTNVMRDCPGVTGDGVTDDYSALQACLNVNAGRHIFFPKTQIVDSSGNHPDYHISQALHMKGYEQWLDGEVGGEAFGGVQIKCDAGGIEAKQSEGVYAPRISNLYPRGANQYVAGSVGIHISAGQALLEHSTAYHFETGIRIDSMSAAENANLFHLTDVRSISNSGDGIYIFGENSNAGITERVSVQNNGGYGINDQSFLGNTHIQPHAAYNALGDYNTKGNPQRNSWINPYSEGGSPISHFKSGDVVINGVIGSGFDVRDGGYLYQPGIIYSTGFRFNGGADGGHVLSQDAAGYKIFQWRDATGGEQWRLSVNAGSWSLSSGSTQYFSASGGSLYFPTNIFRLGQNLYFSTGSQVTGSACGSGTQIRFNDSPTIAVGDPVGWRCLGGQWHSFGTIN